MKKNIKAFLLALAVTGCTNGSNITVEGKVSLKGSEPHTYYVIKDKKTAKLYKIINAKRFNLPQNQTVKIEAKIIKNSNSPTLPPLIEIVKISK